MGIASYGDFFVILKKVDNGVGGHISLARTGRSLNKEIGVMHIGNCLFDILDDIFILKLL